MPLDPVILARAVLIRDFPYLASAAFAVRVKTDPTVPIAAVTRDWVLLIGPGFPTNPKEGAGVLFHELLHLLRDSFGRMAGRHPQLWNIAEDLAINDDVRDHFPLPEGVLYPEQFQFDPGLLGETYYDLIQDRVEIIECAQALSGDLQDREDGDGLTPAQGEVVRNQVAAAVAEAAGRDPWSVPGWLARWAEAALRPTVDWRSVLRSTVRGLLAQAQGRTDYRLDGRNRRQAVSPIILPRLRGPKPRVLVVIDASGSIQDRELSQFLAEIGGITRSLGVPVDVASGDTQLTTFQRGVLDPRKVQIQGGGGTDLGQILTELAPKGRWDVVIILTDGYTPWPSQNHLPCQVVVATTDQPGPRWATTITIGGDR